jgi:hypothetical protein
MTPSLSMTAIASLGSALAAKKAATGGGLRPRKSGSQLTRRWREPDSNHRSRCCKRLCWALPIGTSVRSVEPPKVRSEIARIDLGALPWPFRSRRDRWFESGSLQRGVLLRT